MTLDVRRLVQATAQAALAMALTACTCSSPSGDSAKEPTVQSAVVPVYSAPPPRIADRIPIDKMIRLPSGPALEILPGQGVGAIRLGATVATIERLMALPCEVKTDKECVYVGRAVEFLLDDHGATNEIRIHRVDRPAPDGHTYGVFNGRMQNSLTLMMIPNGVRGLIGNPQKIEQVTNGGANGTVEVDYYDGLRIEYDHLPPDRTVVGGIIITKATKLPPAAPPQKPLPPRPLR